MHTKIDKCQHCPFSRKVGLSPLNYLDNKKYERTSTPHDFLAVNTSRHPNKHQERDRNPSSSLRGRISSPLITLQPQLVKPDPQCFQVSALNIQVPQPP